MFERESMNHHSRKSTCLRRGALALGLFFCAAAGLTHTISVRADAPEVDATSEKNNSIDDRSAVGHRQAMDSAIIDIAVSRIGQTGGDYVAYGTFGGIAAFSGATTACNVGTATAEWWSGGSTARHPLISQNLYRLSADKMRFEMIGMSWLKHSFCAVNEFSCGNCQTTPCSSLGLGCADTYTATRNGSTNLGPRGPVNPVGTQFGGVGPGTHNETFPGPIGNSIIKGRLQVPLADFQAGAEYYWEVHYVTHDEPLSTRYNNASWVKVNMPSPTSQPSSSGSMRMEQVGLRAWEEAWEHTDYPVFFNFVDDEEDGRFNLAYRASKNKDGTWNYEYAVHNMNSRLGALSFKIPIPFGVNVTGIGFHDVAYHSGDGAGGGVNFDGTDWDDDILGEGADRGIQWTVVDPTNPNANALRWGTTYNFRFIANRPPIAVTARIGHYRPSVNGSIEILAFGPTAPSVSCEAADFDDSGEVRVPDLLVLLAAWGPNSGHVADLDGSGDVTVPDLVMLLSVWGPCP